jgi:hypothetical protein
MSPTSARLVVGVAVRFRDEALLEALADSSHVTCNDGLEEAVWFHRLNLPRLPPVVSIALNALMTRSVSDVT